LSLGPRVCTAAMTATWKWCERRQVTTPSRINRMRPARPLRSSAAPGARRPAGGCPPPGSAGGHRASSGTEACLPWPSGTRSWATRARCQPPRRYGGNSVCRVRPCRWVGLPRRIPFVRRNPMQAGPGSERALVGLRPQGTGGSHAGGFPAERRINKTIMQTGPCLLRPHIRCDPRWA
jgi:hypothetical protein